jgi:spermidine synthase
MKKYRLEIIVFIAGAVVMGVEIIGSRLLAPYVGTSLPVWTSIIGIILGSMSIGYWQGGKLADKVPHLGMLARILLAAGAVLAIIALLHSWVLTAIARLGMPTIAAALTDAFVLLSVPGFLLGIVPTYTTRIKLKEITTSGAAIGRLSALSTIGSIVGTFCTGFILLSHLGTYRILLTFAILMMLLSVLADPPRGRRFIATLILVLFCVAAATQNTAAQGAVVDIDSGYSHITVTDTGDIRNMYIGGVTHSGMSLRDSAHLVYPYSQFYRLISHFKPQINDALVLGGGGYSYPKDFLRTFPKANLDVVEIDPAVTAIARQYFFVPESPRLHTFAADGRTFLNENDKKYDAVFGDAFGSYYSVPYQLTTREAAQSISKALTDDGVLLVNVISALEGDAGKFFRAEFWTLKSVFPQVYVFPVVTRDAKTIQNIMIVALKSDKQPTLTNANPELSQYLSQQWEKPIAKDLPVLTDDFAPVEQYIAALLQ